MKKSAIGISFLVLGLFACGQNEVQSSSAAVNSSEFQLPDNTREILTSQKFSADQEKIWKQLDPSMDKTTGTYFGLKAVQYVTNILNKHYTNSRNGEVKFSTLSAKIIPSVTRVVGHERVLVKQGYTSYVLASNKPTSQNGHFACYSVQENVF